MTPAESVILRAWLRCRSSRRSYASARSEAAAACGVTPERVAQVVYSVPPAQREKFRRG